jgi:MSHA biogenesis protein MshJ
LKLLDYEVKFDALGERIDELSIRERLLVLLAATFLLVAGWEALLAAPLQVREQQANAQVASLSQRLAALDETMNVTAASLDSSMPEKLQRLQALRGRLDQADDSFRIFTSDLVDPGQMRFVLEDLIAHQGALRVRSIKSLEPDLLFPQDVTDTEAPRLYRHGLTLELEGAYLDCLSYLQALELLPWRIHWAHIELEAQAYPLNRIAIEVHTLSLQKEWIGV